MAVKYVMWGLLVGSSILLMVLLFRNRKAGRLLSGLALNVVLAAVMLYILNAVSGYTHLELPINTATLATVTLLGVPGILLLACVKVMLI